MEKYEIMHILWVIMHNRSLISKLSIRREGKHFFFLKYQNHIPGNTPAKPSAFSMSSSTGRASWFSSFSRPNKDDEGYMFVPIPSLRPVSFAIANWSPAFTCKPPQLTSNIKIPNEHMNKRMSCKCKSCITWDIGCAADKVAYERKFELTWDMTIMTWLIVSGETHKTLWKSRSIYMLGVITLLFFTNVNSVQILEHDSWIMPIFVYVFSDNFLLERKEDHPSKSYNSKIPGI